MDITIPAAIASRKPGIKSNPEVYMANELTIIYRKRVMLCGYLYLERDRGRMASDISESVGHYSGSN